MRKRRLRLDAMIWHGYDWESQERICRKYDVVLDHYIPRNRVKFRKFDKKVQKYQDMLSRGMAKVSAGADAAVKMTDDMVKQFDSAFKQFDVGNRGMEQFGMREADLSKVWGPGKTGSVWGSERSSDDLIWGSKRKSSNGSIL